VRRGGLTVIGWWLCALCAPVFPAAAGEVAVVVSTANPTDEVSFGDLVRIFRQEKQYWAHGERIYLVMREAGAVERAIIMKKVYKMEDEEIKRFWLGKLYRGEVAEFPQTLASNEAVKRFVSQVPNAIGVVDAAELDGRVKALRIDGKLPTDAGYALSE
jgi:phosphate transport system substrate-binding protein